MNKVTTLPNQIIKDTLLQIPISTKANPHTVTTYAQACMGPDGLSIQAHMKA
jgi:hypothetical protein